MENLPQESTDQSSDGAIKRSCGSKWQIDPQTIDTGILLLFIGGLAYIHFTIGPLPMATW